MARRAREIGLFLPPTVGYFADIVMGVQEYARGGGGGGAWVVEACQSIAIATAATRRWRPDGVLVNNADGEWHRLVRELGVPAVQVGGPVIPDTARVTTDNEAIGRMAAAHFVERGFRHFAFCGYAHLDWSREREAGFRAGLGDDAGRDCPALRAGDGEICAAAVGGSLAEWVRGLRKPAAVFACHDRAAMFLVAACAHARARVPEDVAVLGVDDSALECGFATPPISSIMGSARRVGYEAAALLDRLMGGAAAPVAAVRVPPAGVTVRQSTDVLAVDDADVTAAVRYIGRHASRPIEVRDVAAATLVSRRLLERKFKALLGRTPREEILRAHLARARMLLVNSEAQTLDVALRSGFPSASKFSAVFKRETGLSPTAFRRLYGARPRAGSRAGNPPEPRNRGEAP